MIAPQVFSSASAPAGRRPSRPGSARSGFCSWSGSPPRLKRQGEGRNWPPREGLVVRSDGTPLIMSTPSTNLSVTTYRDLNGQRRRLRTEPTCSRACTWPASTGSPASSPTSQAGSRGSRFSSNEREPTVNWFFVHDGKPEGAGYFVGYERESNRRVGFIGLSGFRSDPVPVDEWIPVRGALITDYSHWSSAPISIDAGTLGAAGLRPDRWDLPPRLVYVPSGNHLRLVDLAARTVTTVFETPEPIESLGVPALSALWPAAIPRRNNPSW